MFQEISVVIQQNSADFQAEKLRLREDGGVALNTELASGGSEPKSHFEGC